MRAKKQMGLGFLVAILGIILQTENIFAYEINDMISIGGVAAGIYQYQTVDDAPGSENEGRGFLVFEPEISFTPTENDEIFAKFGFGAGPGLMEEGDSPNVWIFGVRLTAEF
jgi:hypothetical protein